MQARIYKAIIVAAITIALAAPTASVAAQTEAVASGVIAKKSAKKKVQKRGKRGPRGAQGPAGPPGPRGLGHTVVAESPMVTICNDAALPCGRVTIVAHCPPEFEAIGGGWDTNAAFDLLSATVTQNRRIGPNWLVTIRSNDISPETLQMGGVSAVAVCVASP